MNFAIVAAGENAASPHHEPGPRVIGPGEVVLCDFGGTMLAEGGAGYCSDITRCVVTGEPTAEMAEVYSVLHEAQAAAVAAGHVGTPAEACRRRGRGTSSPTPGTASGSCTAPVTASAWRSTRTPTSSSAIAVR